MAKAQKLKKMIQFSNKDVLAKAHLKLQAGCKGSLRSRLTAESYQQQSEETCQGTFSPWSSDHVLPKGHLTLQEGM